MVRLAKRIWFHFRYLRPSDQPLIEVSRKFERRQALTLGVSTLGLVVDVLSLLQFLLK